MRPTAGVAPQSPFPTEAEARAFLAQWRWPNGFTCPRCSSRRFSFLARRQLWQCSACRRQTSLTAGTALQHTKIPIHTWAYALWLVARPGIRASARQLQREAGLATHRAALHLLHKVRMSLVHPEKRPLPGPVEVGTSWLERPAVRDPKRSPLISVGVATDGTSRAIVDAREHLRSLVAPGAEHRWTWVPIAAFFAGLAAWLARTHHGVSSGYVSLYLNEHVYRSNRRRLGWRTLGYLARRVMGRRWRPVAPMAAWP